MDSFNSIKVVRWPKQNEKNYNFRKNSKQLQWFHPTASKIWCFWSILTEAVCNSKPEIFLHICTSFKAHWGHFNQRRVWCRSSRKSLGAGSFSGSSVNKQLWCSSEEHHHWPHHHCFYFCAPLFLTLQSHLFLSPYLELVDLFDSNWRF